MNTIGKRRGIVSTYETGESSTSQSSHRQLRRQRLLHGPSTLSYEVVQRPLPLYSDCGDCSYVCEYCSARFWYAERVVHWSRAQRPRYSQCCKLGTVRLPFPIQPPAVIKQLFEERHFLENIRAYNSMFSMTSFGAEIDETINDGRGPYVFKISGQISHWIGSLCPQSNEKPRFLQLYIYDTENEISNRLCFFGDGTQRTLSVDIVRTLNDVLTTHNEYVRIFKTAKDMVDPMENDNYSIRLYNNVPDRRYGAPAPGTLGGVVCGDDVNSSEYDIIIHSKDGTPQRVSKLHPCYMPLQYPLLFPFGEEGWSTRLRLHQPNNTKDRRLTVNMYYSYQIHDRVGVYSLLLHGGRLFQQYLVDAYTCIEQNRLTYYHTHQDQLRSEYIAGIYDALSKGDTESREIGKRIFLPASFTGGPRYMYRHYQDALAICRVHGNPQYFITFTCNVKWPEITRYMDSIGSSDSQNRPDIIARVFKLKVQEFIKFMKDDKTFGEVAAYLYTIEFQKRGLPHCHTLLWVTTPYKIQDAAAVDDYITAEFPDPQLEASLYHTITESMLHGPCGLLNPAAPCMRDGKCSKHFPKSFQPTTTFDKDGYVHYKRHPGIYHVLRSGIHVNNGYVVPYNKRLCSRFNAHINVEYCGWNRMIKYLFKYISKGVDRIRFVIQKSESDVASTSAESTAIVNEIQNFVDGRFICPHEACWRILDFPIHERDPAVQILAVHLENMQNVTFKENSRLQSIINSPGFGKTTLTEWLSNNSKKTEGLHLTYSDYPSMFRWDSSAKGWIRRARLGSTAIGRLVYVHPTVGELFYLRMLLCHQKGCKSYADIRTVANITYTTFRATCEALGLIGDDREWLEAFTDASSWATSSELRYLFCHLLLFCEVSNPLVLWESQWRKMADDLLPIVGASKKILNSSTPSKSLKDFGLPLPSESVLAILKNRLLLEETSYDRSALQLQHSKMQSQLNVHQLKVYKAITTAHINKTQTLLFVSGHGGTGKTFLWTTILSYFRSVGKIALAVAASGIASLLLPSGRTAHSRFNIPIDLSDESSCNIKKNTQLANLLKQTSIVVWDEAPMSDRRCFECLDRTLKDILENDTQLFGGMSILLGGDFRQTLPVKQKSTRSQILASTLPNSYLWPSFKVYTLHHNMRLTNNTQSVASTHPSATFASWLLDIGNGEIGRPDKEDPQNTKIIQIPSNYLIQQDHDSLQSLIDFVYEEETLRTPSATNMSNRAIVCPKNDTADEINNLILTKITGETITYISYDSMIPHSQHASDLETLYPQEYLNQLTFSGIPPNKLLLKRNTPIMLLRNINQTLGLCNGTRMLVSQLLPKVIEAFIITGTSIGKRVYIPRIKFVHNTPDLPFTFTRRQFPVKICYAMTINKSQGQSLNKIGVYLPQPVFTHGQLYVALSRATSPNSLKILISSTEATGSNETKNVVFRDLLTQVNNNQVRTNENQEDVDSTIHLSNNINKGLEENL